MHLSYSVTQDDLEQVSHETPVRRSYLAVDASAVLGTRVELILQLHILCNLATCIAPSLQSLRTLNVLLRANKTLNAAYAQERIFNLVLRHGPPMQLKTLLQLFVLPRSVKQYLHVDATQQLLRLWVGTG